MKLSVHGCVISVLAITIASTAAPVGASSLVNQGHTAGAQCGAADIDNHGFAVGTCVPGNVNGPSVAWVSQSGGASGTAGEIALKPLAAGMSCAAGGIDGTGTAAQSGHIIGACSDASGVGFAVTWANSGASPQKLNPLGGLLGTVLFADVSTVATAYNQSGYVGGQSISTTGTSTAVVWAPGSSTPILVSSANDNCGVADVQDSPSGSPNVLLNCPNANGTVTAKLATPTGLLTPYATAVLPNPTLPPGAPAATLLYCGASGMNASGQIVGSCAYNVPPYTQAVRWSGSPLVANAATLSASGTPIRTAGATINASGLMAIAYQRVDGHAGVALYNMDTTPYSFVLMNPPTAGTGLGIAGFGDNGILVVNGETADGHAQAYVYSGSTLSPVAFLPGGVNDGLSVVSKNGVYAAGGADDVNHTSNAVVTSLP